MAKKVKVQEKPYLYDWLYENDKEDIPMYIRFAKDHNVVLECGIGTGRIAIPMAKAGKEVYGIDNSHEMLERLDENLSKCPQEIRERIHRYYGDMIEFNLNKQFSFIYIPFSTFNYLLNQDDQKSCLNSVKNHLAPGGTVVIELLSFSYSPHWLENEPVMRKVKEAPDLNSDCTIEMWKTSSFDSSSQLATEDRHFRFYSQAGVLQKEEVIYWENRFLLFGELKLLLEMCGFRIQNTYGDFQSGKYQHNSNFLVVEIKAAD